MDVFHGFTGVLHGEEGLLVDVGGFDGVDLVLQHGDLRGGLFEGVLVCLFAFERRAGGWERWTLAELFIYIEPKSACGTSKPPFPYWPDRFVARKCLCRAQHSRQLTSLIARHVRLGDFLLLRHLVL